VLWGGYAGTGTELSFTTAGYIYEIDRDVWRRVPRSPEGEGEGGAERKSGVWRGNTRCIGVGRGGEGRGGEGRLSMQCSRAHAMMQVRWGLWRAGACMSLGDGRTGGTQTP
jgi:hypothetical protein